jgi:hypothetical protein
LNVAEVLQAVALHPWLTVANALSACKKKLNKRVIKTTSRLTHPLLSQHFISLFELLKALRAFTATACR